MVMPVMDNRLLLVDKDHNLLDLLSIMFRREGYDLTCCTNGKLAMSTLVEKSQSLVLSDAGLPDMCGKRFLAEVKHAARFTRVAMMSIDPYEHRQFELIGALKFVSKPLSRQQLVSALADIRQDRRTTPRLPLRVPLRINHQQAAVSVNFSSDGALVEGAAAFTGGQRIEVSVDAGNNTEAFSAAGTVVRSDRMNGHFQTAVFFQENIGHRMLDHIAYFEQLLFQ
jgi:DNA-binding response OmpR family regulator